MLLSIGYSGLTGFWTFRTVPTEEEILVPETLLKKRKSQEKAREDRLVELKKKRAVGLPPKILKKYSHSEYFRCER